MKSQYLKKIKSSNQLAQMNLSSKKWVFTNGCFDLLHLGHLQYLEKARSLGDILVVALNSDASVRRLKGNTRPINPLRDRMSLLAGLSCVDWVSWFTADTPLKLILMLKPPILVKGGDWKLNAIVGGVESRSWGGKVKTISYLPARSTTTIIQKIKSTRSRRAVLHL